MLFGELVANRVFQVGTPDKRLTDKFLSKGNGLAIDSTYALYQFPDDMPVAEVVDDEQPEPEVPPADTDEM